MDYISLLLLYHAILGLCLFVSSPKLHKLLGLKPILALVPGVNYWQLLKALGLPKWWIVIAMLPIVGPILISAIHVTLIRKFGKNKGLDTLLCIVLPYIYLAVVNYNSATQLIAPEEQEEKKESLLSSLTFAAVFASTIHIFITQPFVIPTGSMESTLLVGDFLFVNKLKYGYRMPTRPLAIPFLQGTIKDTGIKGNPIDDPKSYVDGVQLPYFRLPGYSKVEKNDIVVFNYPADSVHTAIDRKDPYVKRCVATGGDVVEMRQGRLFINQKPEAVMGDAEQQHSYTALCSSQLDIPALYKQFGFFGVQEVQNANNTIYVFDGLNSKLLAEIKQLPEMKKIEENLMPKGQEQRSYDKKTNQLNEAQSIFPINKNWNQDEYGPIKIPKKGDVITLNADTYPMYKALIGKYEGNTLEQKANQFFINGQAANTYTVKQDYYWMMGDNRDGSLDARFFGFVPEDHIVGSPMFSWMSLQGMFGETSLDEKGKKVHQAPFKVRWERMFKATNNGEKQKTSYWPVAVILLGLFFGWDTLKSLFNKKKKNND